MSSDLKTVVDHMWSELCDWYDLDIAAPSLREVVLGVDDTDHREAARGVLVNAVVGLVDEIGHFSPWYTEPTSTFGLATLPRRSGEAVAWGLTEDAQRRYRDLLDDLAVALKTETSLVEAIRYLSDRPDDREASG